MRLTSTYRRALGATLITVAAACAQRAPVADVGAALTAPAIQFVEPSVVDLGAPPNAVVVADLDGDGHPDLAAATGARGVTVALARDGGFAPPRAYAAGNASGLIAGDLDGDGRTDLVVVNDAGVSVLLGRGDGSFGAPRSSGVGGSPGAIVAGDLDGDGKLDLAVADTANGRVAVLLGKGDGSFQPATSYAVGARRITLARGDVDGDGKLDLVAVPRGGRMATSLFGKGDGTFRIGPERQICSEECRLHAVAAGDFDGDGKLDLAIAWSSTSSDYYGSISLALGEGDGTFRWAGRIPGFDRSKPSAVAVVDLDGDGKLDIVADISRGNVVVTALGKGDGTLGAPAYHRAAGPLLAAADLDGDGKPDVVAAGGDGVAVSPGNGDGTLRAPRAFEVGDESGGTTGKVVAGDFNHDGFADVAVTYDDTTIAHVEVLLGDGRGTLRHAWGHGLGDSSASTPIYAVDVDGDGVIDLASAEYLRVWLGNGDGTFREVKRTDSLSGRTVAFGDFDGDGKPDAVLSRGDYATHWSGVVIRPGKGDGTFAKDRETSVTLPSLLAAVAVADLDGDGHADLAVSAGGSLLLLLGKGDGTFAPARPVDGPAGAAIAAADLDGDGRIDLVVAHAGEDVSTVLLNAGGGAFRSAGTVASSGKLQVADMDGDGIPDVLAHGGVLVHGGVPVIYRGKGDGTFEAGRRYGPGGNDFAVADVDGDGRADVVTTVGAMSPFVAVLRSASR